MDDAGTCGGFCTPPPFLVKDGAPCRQYLDSIAVDAWKIKVGAIAGLLCAAGVIIAFQSHDGRGPSYDYEDLSPDCQHVDTALRAWGRVIPAAD